MTGNGDKNSLGIFWIDSQLWDLLTVAQSEIRPRLAGIGRFINTVAN